MGSCHVLLQIHLRPSLQPLSASLYLSLNPSPSSFLSHFVIRIQLLLGDLGLGLRWGDVSRIKFGIFYCFLWKSWDFYCLSWGKFGAFGFSLVIHRKVRIFILLPSVFLVWFWIFFFPFFDDCFVLCMVLCLIGNMGCNSGFWLFIWLLGSFVYLLWLEFDFVPKEFWCLLRLLGFYRLWVNSMFLLLASLPDQYSGVDMIMHGRK